MSPTRVFHGRIPHNKLNHKLGINPNEKVQQTTDFAEKLQKKTQVLIDQIKRNFLQSYLKYEYITIGNYDRKAHASPLKENDFFFVLQPKADHQGSKIPFSDSRWVGPYIIQKALPNDNYIVRVLGVALKLIRRNSKIEFKLDRLRELKDRVQAKD